MTNKKPINEYFTLNADGQIIRNDNGLRRFTVNHSPLLIQNKDGEEFLLTIYNDVDSSNPREDNDNLCSIYCFLRHYKLGDKHNYQNAQKFLCELCKQYTDINEDILEDLDWHEMYSRLSKSDKIAIKTIRYYDHGGISLSLSDKYPYNDRWDSGMAGFVFIDKETVFKEQLCLINTDRYGNAIYEEHIHEKTSPTYSVATIPLTEENWKEIAYHNMDMEIKTYNQYLQNDIYWYSLEKKEHIKDIKRCPHCDEIISVDEYDTYEEVDSCCNFYGDNLFDNGIFDSVGCKCVLDINYKG